MCHRLCYFFIGKGFGIYVKRRARRTSSWTSRNFERIGTQKSECYKLLFMMSTSTFIWPQKILSTRKKVISKNRFPGILGTIKIRHIITKLKTVKSYVLCSALVKLWVFATRGGGSIPARDNSFLHCPQSPHFFAIFLHENEVYVLWCKNKKWSVSVVLHDRLKDLKKVIIKSSFQGLSKAKCLEIYFLK